MATTEWVQKAGQSSETDVDNINTLVEQAETAEANASASETAAASSATSAASSSTTAATSATSASTSASAASTSASAASASETAAGTSETNSAASASAASTSATSAATSATNAATSEANASTSATAASTSATNAATSATSAETAYDNFDDRYLGDKASDPTLDNDGDALVTGALYYSTVSNVMKVYSGSAWQDVAPVATSVTVSQISDLTATATELNYSSGVTSAIQTQLDAKGTVSSLSDLSVTASATELNYSSGVTSAIQTQLDAKGTVSSLSDLSVTATATELNYSSGVTSGIQTQLNAKALSFSPTLSGRVTFLGAIDETVYNFTGTVLEPYNGTIQFKNLTGDTVLGDSISQGESMTLMINDGSARTITWPTMTWVNNGGSPPTLATTGYTVVVLWKVGSTLYGALVGDGS